MRRFSFFLTLLLAGYACQAQSTEDSVKTVINTLFNAMRNGDTGSLLSTFSESAIMQTIVQTREGKTIVRNESVQDFGKMVGSLMKDSADERITFEAIKIDGPLAIVWTPYEFYFNGKYSHRGVNSFQLVRMEGEWKIQYLIDTRRR